MRSVVSALLVTAAIVVTVACREPTSIVLQITTDVPCADLASAGGVDVRVGTPANVELAPSTQIAATTCVGKQIGSLVIVPSSSADETVGVFVAVASKANASVEQGLSKDCASESPGSCVIARRVVSFVPHTTLTLPIHLGLACVSVVCPGGQTCDPNTGSCQADDACVKNPELCTPVVDAGVSDGGVACPRCGGPNCIDFLTDPNNCGTCKSVCKGACQDGGCILTPNAKGTDAQGCLTVGQGTVVWGITGNYTGALAAVPTVGASTGTVLAANGNFDDVAAGSGFSVIAGTTPPSTSTLTDWTWSPLAPSGTSWTLAAAAQHFHVGRSKSGDRCATFRNPGGKTAVGCPPKFAETTVTGAPGPIAVGKSIWAAILDPDTATSRVVFGDLAKGTLLSNSAPTAIAFARAISVVPGTNDFFLAQDKSVVNVNFDAMVGPQVAMVGSAPIRGVHSDGTTVYFADTPANVPGRIRRFPWTTGEPTVPFANAKIMAGSWAFTQHGPEVCFDVDESGVYFLSNGLPIRRTR